MVGLRGALVGWSGRRGVVAGGRAGWRCRALRGGGGPRL